jgi:hypothetical protein
VSRFSDRSSCRSVWLIGTCCLTAIGLAAALVFMNWSTIVVVFLLTALVGGSIHFNVAAVQEKATTRLLTEAVRWALRASVGVLAICGYVAAVGLATLPLLGLIAATSPLVLRQQSARSMPADDRLAEAPPPAPPASPEKPPAGAGLPGNLEDLSDEDLCLAWRRSFTALQNCDIVENQLALIEARERYLDELERRRPDAFAEWLQTMPRAAGDPTRYYVRGPARGTST